MNGRGAWCPAAAYNSRMLDPRDGIYAVLGLAMLGLTLHGALRRAPWFNLPLLYVGLGVAAGAFGLPYVDPAGGKTALKVIEHASELIVIVSLAGVGLALDAPLRWATWRSAVRLLGVAMPLTILFCVAFGIWGLGLSLASAVLLGAALAPTDPVLARSVQVGPPGDDEPAHKFALTAEAGLNDGLAFPFVYLAIALAGTGMIADWGPGWLGFDVVYRVAVGVGVGVGIGLLLSRFAFSRFGDAQHGENQTLLMVLGATFLSYGVTEAVDGYGFLAVFACAAAGRRDAHRREAHPDAIEADDTEATETSGHAYTRHAHEAAEQIESVLLAVLLLGFGAWVGAGGLAGLTAAEIGFTALLLLVVRPLAGWLSLLGLGWQPGTLATAAFFGIRGMGTVFYLAYGLTHADFAAADTLWRVAGLTILVSITLHGFAAGFLISEDDEAGG